MERFLLGMIVGVLIERYHLAGGTKPEADMNDFLYIVLIALAFGFMGWAIRALKS